MDQRLVIELIKELAVGFKAARSYPVGHPVFEQAIAGTMSVLRRIFAEYPEFTINLSENSLTLGDMNVETGRNLALASLIENLMKKDIRSIVFRSNVGQHDVATLFSVMASPAAQIDDAKGPAAMLASRGVENIEINTSVIHSGTREKRAQVAKTHEEIIESIRGLMEIVRANPAVSDSRVPFTEILKDIEAVSRSDWRSYSEAIVGVVDLLPLEKRVALLQDLEMRPFVLTMLSCLSTETLVLLMTNWERQGRRTNIIRVMGVIDKEKFGHIVPMLKNRDINVYEYLSNAGINPLLEEEVAATIDDDDFKIALQPYYSMLESKEESVRREAFKSLLAFTKRLVAEKKHAMANNIVSRLALAIEQEPGEDLLLYFIPEIEKLYSPLTEVAKRASCDRLIEAFGKVLGRASVSLALRKQIIQFLMATKDPAVLPMLFSFLWESGLYPDARTAIISFGGRAVDEALQLLRDAEDFSVRMKLVDILKNIGQPSIEVLARNLQAREWFLRRNIVRIFGEIGEASVAPRLEILLKDEDPRVRLELARTFVKLDHKDGLMKALHDASHEVKGEALRGLKKFLDAEEIIGLLPQLSETGDEVYLELIRIIDEKKIYEAADWIADLLKRFEWRTDPAAYKIKESGVATLAKLDGNNTKMMLLELQNSKDKTLANLAASTLRRIG